MKALWLAVLLVTAVVQTHAAPMDEVKLEYSNPQLIPAQWTLVVWPDGRGHFQAVRGNAAAPDSSSIEPQVIDQDVHLSGEYAGRIFEMLQRHPPQPGHCENHSKVAYQGTKTLEYRGPDGTRTCTFNYAKDRELGEVANSMMSVAATLIEGARLTMIWQHDPLGLDKEIEFIMEAAADGRLQQICAIRDTLQRLAADPGVMERVRKRAAKLSESSQ